MATVRTTFENANFTRFIQNKSVSQVGGVAQTELQIFVFVSRE